jgi:hypothetical protein
MKRNVIALCSLVLLCGCNKQYEYPQGVDHAAKQIGPGLDSLKWNLVTNSVETVSTNQIIILDPKGVDLNIPVMYPYFLHDRKKIDHGYEWQVRQDVSGMFRNAGKLRLYGKDNSLIVDAPNDVVEAFVIKTLELKSPTTKSTLSSEGAPSDER